MPTDPPFLAPRALHEGARVALVAPSGAVRAARIERAVEDCRALDLAPVVYPSAGACHRYLAGPDDLRLADLQSALDDPSIDGVWVLRGGYGTLRILDRLDLSRQRRDPIPFIGFSDNTTIHLAHREIGVISFHGPHPGAHRGRTSLGPLEWTRAVLFGGSAPGSPPPDPDVEVRALVGGRAEGRLIGGNLSMLAAMCGGAHQPGARGGILFLEDVGEPAYRVDRMLVQLDRAGFFDGVKGLAFGSFTPPSDPSDEHSVEEVLLEFAEQLAVPAVMGLPFGHVDHNCVVPVGAMARLDGETGTLTVVEPTVLKP